MTAAVIERVQLRPAHRLVLTGSLPPNTPPTWYADLVKVVRSMGVEAVLDAAGEALRWGALAGPWMIKVNRTEFLSLVAAWPEGLELASSEDERIDELARSLVISGTCWVVVTNGPGDTQVWGQNGRWTVETPSVLAVNPTGSGDAFLAGLLVSDLRPQSMETALKRATAAAVSNALRIMPEVGSKGELEALAESVNVSFTSKTLPPRE